ncbi:MAG: hypothetical protein AAAFM81_06925 [Pseudomonadota bacterium]
MDDQQDIYAPPTADLAQATEAEGAAQFYVVGRLKFHLLFFFTIGLYKVYWFYKNWALYRDSMNVSMYPIPRGIFSIFFTHALFGEVEAKRQSNNQPFTWNPSGLATVYIVLFLIGWFGIDLIEILGLVAEDSVTSILVHFSFLYGAFFISIFVFDKAQRAVNAAAGDPNGDANRHLTGANWFWIILGVLYWAGNLLLVSWFASVFLGLY